MSQLEEAVALLEEFRSTALELIAKAKTPAELEVVRVLLVGRESGLLNVFRSFLGGGR